MEEFSEPPLLPAPLFKVSSNCLFFSGLLILFSVHLTGQEKPLAELVNPFIGTGGHGHTFPGATSPFGMVQLSPDTRLEGWDGCSGYHYSDNVIYGFSHTHLSGTGVADYCDLLLMPFTGEDKWENGSLGGHLNGYGSKFSHSFEKADAGYYSVQLDDDKILAELTTTPRCGYHRYTYPDGEKKKIIIDLEHRDALLDCDLFFINDTTLVGKRISSSWAAEQHIYFAMRFSEIPIRKQFWKEAGGIDKPTKLILEFESDYPLLEVKAALSAVDINGAINNLRTEVPGWGFEDVKMNNQLDWEEELAKVQVWGKNPDRLRIFYTAAYHACLSPNVFSDCDGRYRGMDHKIYSSDGNRYTVFSLWDTFRALHPFFTITQVRRTEEMIATMLEQYRTGGLLPIWELAANETKCMIGNHALSVISDAYVKGIRNFKPDAALIAMVHSATQDHLGLKAYKLQGYISSEDESESVSKTLEYAYNDWCIAVMADSLGQTELSEVFYHRSQAWKNLYNPTSGFLEPRYNGGWKTSFRPEEVTFDFTEANAWQYSMFVPHDLTTYLELIGGKDSLEKHLDNLFNAPSVTSGREQADITGLIGQYAHGNEPSHHIAYLYNYTNRPEKSQRYVHQICTKLYGNYPDGLCGNEDCGQMSAWYLFSAMGFYPVTPGTENYLFGTPLFDSCQIQLENGNAFKIVATNLSEANFYVKRVSLNGKYLNRNYIRHSEIVQGGTLIFEMSPSADNVSTDAPVQRIPGQQFAAAPYVTSSAVSFEKKKKIRLSAAKGTEIRFTLDGSLPSDQSERYEKPLVIKKSTEIVSAVFRDGQMRFFAKSKFNRSQNKWTIRLNSEYQNQYSGGGRSALIDQLYGGTDFRTGGWQGYLGRDVDVTVDFRKKEQIRGVYLNCLQDVGSWIWFPKEIQVLISNNGRDWFTAGTETVKVSAKERGPLVMKFGIAKVFSTRYLRIVAKYAGPCPDWHPGVGNPSHIFADEMIIEPE